MKNADNVTQFESGRDEALGRLYREALVGPIGDEAVDALRRRVGRSIGRRRAAVPPAAGLGLAAALLLAIFVPALRGPGATRTAANGPGLHVTRAADGAVVLEFDRPEAVHRVAKSLRPQPGTELWSRLPAGRRLVDRNGTPAPGTVVFYRVD